MPPDDKKLPGALCCACSLMPRAAIARGFRGAPLMGGRVPPACEPAGLPAPHCALAAPRRAVPRGAPCCAARRSLSRQAPPGALATVPTRESAGRAAPWRAPRRPAAPLRVGSKRTPKGPERGNAVNKFLSTLLGSCLAPQQPPRKACELHRGPRVRSNDCSNTARQHLAF